jgi:purine-binding chemotaxis protein CheW
VSGVQVRVGIGREQYALPVEAVLEVVELGDLTPVPGSRPEVLGVFNLRGRVIPAIALATVLGLEGEESARIVVVEADKRIAGLAVDTVIDVGELPEAAEQVDSPYLTGAALLDGGLVGVLDAEAVLASVSVPEGPA